MSEIDPKDFYRLRDKVDSLTDSMQKLVNSVERQSLEFVNHVQSQMQYTAAVQKYVTDPDEGSRVVLRHLKANHEILDKAFADYVKEKKNAQLKTKDYVMGLVGIIIVTLVVELFLWKATGRI